jgi:hypothetical protein
MMETFVMFTMLGGFLMGVGSTIIVLGLAFYIWGK